MSGICDSYHVIGNDCQSVPSIKGIIYSPGNHEWLNPQIFMNWIGVPDLDWSNYADAVISTNHINLVTINSNEELSTIQPFLEGVFDGLVTAGNQNPTWILTHHTVWENGPTSFPFAPFKGYDFLPIIEGEANTIISGDANVDISKQTPSPSATSPTPPPRF